MSRNNRIWRGTTALAVLALGATMVVGEDLAPAYAAPLSLVARVAADGTAPFDPASSPGMDDGPTNGIVRTNDTITFDVQYNLDSSGAVAPRLHGVLPHGVQWEALPLPCGESSATASGIFDSSTGEPGGDRRALTCTLAPSDGTASSRLAAVARVTTAALQGDRITATFTLSGPTLPTPLVAEAGPLTVSAGLSLDLSKHSVGNPAAVDGPGPDGQQPGFVRNFAFAVRHNPAGRTGADAAKGLTPVDGPMTIVDDLSHYSPGAVLYDWGDGGPGCGPLAGSDALPNSAIGLFGPNYTAANSVPDSGTITCAPGTGPDHRVAITIEDADTSGSSFPTRSGTDAALASSDRYIITGLIRVWIPNDDVVAGPDGSAGTSDDNQLVVTNTFLPFDPVDVTGRHNYGDGAEPADNNSVQLSFTAGIAWSKTIRDYDSPASPPGASGIWTGDLLASTGYRFRSVVALIPHVVDAPNSIVCDVFDNSALDLASGPNGSPPAFVESPVAGSDYVIEYGAGTVAPTDFAGLRSATCDDADATWSTDPTSPALGGALTEDGVRSSIDRVRARFLVPVPANTDNRLMSFQHVTGLSTIDAARNADGTLITNWGRVRSGTDPRWLNSTYDPVTHTGTQTGDRIRWVAGIVRVTKTALETASGSGSQVAAGSTVTFTATGTVTVPGAPTTRVRDVVITNILPATEPRLTIEPAAATVPPGGSTEFCDRCDGGDWSATPPSTVHGVRWRFGDVTPNAQLPTMAVAVKVPLHIIGSTSYDSTAIASSPDDPSPVADRSSTANIIAVAPATVLASKSVTTPTVPPNTSASWLLELRNNTPANLNRIDIVDVLPHNGDGRSPATVRTGTLTGVAVEDLPAGMAAYITDAPPEVLDGHDGAADGYANPGQPSDDWYTAPGTGIWTCLLGQQDAPGCPRTDAITAVRLVSTVQPELHAGETVSLALTMSWDGNHPSDVYSNRFAALVDQDVLSLPVLSPDATARVVALGEEPDPPVVDPGDAEEGAATPDMNPGTPGDGTRPPAPAEAAGTDPHALAATGADHGRLAVLIPTGLVVVGIALQLVLRRRRRATSAGAERCPTAPSR